MGNTIKLCKFFGIVASLMFATVQHAAAQEATAKLDSGDTAWMIVATALVLMMTVPGLMLFYGGMVRKKNALSTVAQSFAVCCLATILWMVAGYSLAFSEGNMLIGGLDKIFLTDLKPDALSGTT